jgi:hypothetical protein
LSAATDDELPDVSIIVVTWNCSALALRCLGEIYRSRLGRGFEVIVVDNASTDGTVERIAGAFPGVRLIANPTNAGFARANNQAMRMARGRTLLLLNPDAFPTTPGTFAGLLDVLDAADFAAVGCRLINPDGSHQVGDAGWRPTPWHVVVHALGLSQVLRSARGLFVVRGGTMAPGTIDVDWVCGACLLVRADVVRRHGGLDEGYFMYGEDVEFGCRLRDRGLRVGYAPRQTVLHIQGGTRADGDAVSTRWLDSLGNVYGALNSGRHWFTFRAAMALGFLLRAVAYRGLALLPGRQAVAARAHAMMRYASHVWRMRRPANCL